MLYRCPSLRGLARFSESYAKPQVRIGELGIKPYGFLKVPNRQFRAPPRRRQIVPTLLSEGRADLGSSSSFLNRFGAGAE
jgi:hypothetical protein